MREQPQLLRLKAPDDQTVTVFIVHILEQVAFTLDCAFHLENSFVSVGGCVGPLSPRCNFIPLVPLSGQRLLVTDQMGGKRLVLSPPIMHPYLIFKHILLLLIAQCTNGFSPHTNPEARTTLRQSIY